MWRVWNLDQALLLASEICDFTHMPQLLGASVFCKMGIMTAPSVGYWKAERNNIHEDALQTEREE